VKLVIGLQCAAAIDMPTISPVLQKARIDNMKQYIEKKRLRLAEKQKGRTDEILSADDVTVHVEEKRHKAVVDN